MFMGCVGVCIYVYIYVCICTYHPTYISICLAIYISGDGPVKKHPSTHGNCRYPRAPPPQAFFLLLLLLLLLLLSPRRRREEQRLATLFVPALPP